MSGHPIQKKRTPKQLREDLTQLFLRKMRKRQQCCPVCPYCRDTINDEGITLATMYAELERQGSK
jgi:hypothetical protein